MNTVGQLIRDANPIQGEPSLLAEDELNALLLLALSRSGNMDVQELTKPVEPEKRQRSGWLIAAASFAVVIVFVGAVMLLANPADELPPATTPPTTQAVTPTTEAAVEEAPEESPATTAAPDADALSADDQAFAEAFVTAFNERDRDAILQSLDPSANFNTALQPDSGVDGFSDELSYRWALNGLWEIQDCKFEFSAIVCGMDVSRDDFPDTSEPLSAKLRLIVDDGTIGSLSLIEDKKAIFAMIPDFYDWVRENYPGSLSQMTWGQGTVPLPVLTEESIALWVQLIPEYKATLGG